MSLALDVEYLTGVARAAVGPDSPGPDWPPQIDRVFSALVATWALRGEDRREAEALEWLEGQEPPRIVASEAHLRTAPKRFVPPNDHSLPKKKLDSLAWYRDYLAKGVPPPEKGGYRKAWMAAAGVMPVMRERKERLFPSALPLNASMQYVWPLANPDDAVFRALQRLAADTAYVGHSASLTRCYFRRERQAVDGATSSAPLRRIYPGRLTELRRDFALGRRPQPGATVREQSESEPAGATGVFSDRWLVLEHVFGEVPDLRACALVAKAIRDALLAGYGRIGCTVPAAVSGHAPDGAPTRDPHLAIVPMPFAGFPHADGHVLGFALVPPRGSELLEDSDFRRALREIAPFVNLDGTERRVIEIGSSEHRFRIGLAPTLRSDRRSLDAGLYVGRSRIFATVTPIALDRHLKSKGEARQGEITALIVEACRNIGLPEPVRVLAHKHPALEGVPSAWPSSGSPGWMRWRLPAKLGSRPLTHALIEFAEPVTGPVLLGCGRFVGLGLCRPLSRGEVVQ